MILVIIDAMQAISGYVILVASGLMTNAMIPLYMSLMTLMRVNWGRWSLVEDVVDVGGIVAEKNNGASDEMITF